MDTPGKGGTTFKLTITPDMFKKQMIIDNIDRSTLEVLSEPVRHRYQWYWKILYYLTFGVFFWEYYSYDVKIIEDDKT